VLAFPVAAAAAASVLGVCAWAARGARPASKEMAAAVVSRRVKVIGSLNRSANLPTGTRGTTAKFAAGFVRLEGCKVAGLTAA
jgi:hypothetical protein